MSESLVVPTMAEMMAQGKQPEILFWVGSTKLSDIFSLFLVMIWIG